MENVKKMKPINMCRENATELIESELSKIQSKSKVRTLMTFEVAKWLDIVTDTLKITKKAMNGISVIIDVNAQSFPSAYKYIPQSTIFEAVYKNGSWRVTDIYRGRCGNIRVKIHHTDDSLKAIQERFSHID